LEVVIRWRGQLTSSFMHTVQADLIHQNIILSISIRVGRVDHVAYLGEISHIWLEQFLDLLFLIIVQQLDDSLDYKISVALISSFLFLRLQILLGLLIIVPILIITFAR